MGNNTGAKLWVGIKSIAMTILFPGVVVGLLPFGYIIRQKVPPFSDWTMMHGIASLFAIIGLVILLRSIWEFAHIGGGTLAPFDEPKKLVVQGLYKYVRNPMYVGVYLILIGETLFFLSRGLLLWSLIFFTASNVFVVFFEEPRLRNKYGADYDRYCSMVRRWIPGKAYQVEVQVLEGKLTTRKITRAIPLGGHVILPIRYR